MTTETKKRSLTIEQAFDMVAPIAIYHRTDVCFERQAKKSLGLLKKISAEQLAVHSVALPDEKLDDLNDWAKDTYDMLFWAIIESYYPNWTWEWDRWGAKAVKDGNGRLVFSGDDAWCFPWYETAELLINRLDEHRRECLVSFARR